MKTPKQKPKIKLRVNVQEEQVPRLATFAESNKYPITEIVNSVSVGFKKVFFELETKDAENSVLSFVMNLKKGKVEPKEKPED